MQRAGGWFLGAVAVAAMAGGAWVAFQPILNRETIYIGFSVLETARPPSSDAMFSGAQFAVEEWGSKAGGCRIDFQRIPAEFPKDPDLLIQGSEERLLFGNVATSFIRLFPSLEDQGRASAAWVKESGTRKTVVLCDPATSSSTAILRGFSARAQELGLEVGVPLDTAKDRTRLLDRILAVEPDLVYYSGEAAPYTTAFDLFDALRKRGYAGRLAMGDADPEVSFLAVSNRVVEGTLLISPIGPPSNKFAAAYEPATGRRAGPHAWPAYLTMQAILEVVDRAASRHPEDLRRALAEHPPAQRPCALYEMKAGKFEFVRDLEK